MDRRVYIDIEWECPWDLSKTDGHGAYACASNPKTKMTCVSIYDKIQNKRFRFTYHELQEPHQKAALKATLLWYLRERYQFVAHNAEFEQVCLGCILGLWIPAERWICTMAKAAYYGYPIGLDDVAMAIGASRLKDAGGKEIMLKLVKGKHTPETKPEWYARLYDYCDNDVVVCAEVDSLIPDLPPYVFGLWCLNNRVNMRGVPVDQRAIQNALAIIQKLGIENKARMAELTGGKVQTVGQIDKILDFVRGEGVDMTDLQAYTVELTLKKQLPPIARKVLELRQKAGLSSLAKYKKIANYLVNGHLYQMHFWYGTHTGRPTGEGPQALNYPRDDDPIFKAQILSRQPELIQFLSQPDDHLKGALRGTICVEEDEEAITWDLSQIEARGTFWLANETKGLALFNTSDPYCTYGRTLFGREINKKDDPEERNTAKASVLANGFGGGIGAAQRIQTNYRFDFNIMARLVLPTASPSEMAEAHYCRDYYMSKNNPKPLSQDEALAVDILKQRYRKDFPTLVEYWRALEHVFIHGGWANYIHVEARGSLRIMTLPNGVQAFYHGVEWREIRSKNGKTKYEYSYQGRYGTVHLWYGVIIENAAQMLNEQISCWYRLEADKIAPIFHQCYDEASHRVHKSNLETRLAALNHLLTNERPPFVPGMPIAYDIQHNRRYGK